MHIREYQLDDKNQIKKLVDASLFDIFGSPAQNIEDLDDIEKIYQVFYVATENENIIWTIGIKKEWKDTARIQRMYVDKQQRWKWIGKKLLQKAIEFCQGNDYKKIILSTFPQMKHAILFYQKQGFKQYSSDAEGKMFFEMIL